jgi:hypothetical protein
MTSILKVSEIQDPTNSNTALTIDSAGRVTQPEQPHYVGIDMASSINTGSSATYVTVVHSITQINTGGHYNTSTGEFTCPVAGRYFFEAHFLSRATAAHNVELQKNGAVWTKTRDILTSGNEASIGCSTVVDCAAGDVLRVQVSNDSGGDFFYGWNGTTIYLLG